MPWIRSVFVDPRYARHGLARRLMELAEREAVFSGYRQFQLIASITGVPFYEALGYESTAQTAVPLPGGLSSGCGNAEDASAERQPSRAA